MIPVSSVSKNNKTVTEKQIQTEFSNKPFNEVLSEEIQDPEINIVETAPGHYKHEEESTDTDSKTEKSQPPQKKSASEEISSLVAFWLKPLMAFEVRAAKFFEISSSKNLKEWVEKVIKSAEVQTSQNSCHIRFTDGLPMEIKIEKKSNQMNIQLYVKSQWQEGLQAQLSELVHYLNKKLNQTVIVEVCTLDQDPHSGNSDPNQGQDQERKQTAHGDETLFTVSTN